MASIWDQPLAPGTSTDVTADKTGRPIPMMAPDTRGLTTHGPLSTSEGRGVLNGRPYGVQLQVEQQELTQAYRYRPDFAARLRAATNKALGR